ncbi:MAG TPA: hypothetical protein VIK82_11870 [Porticoccaceae bacterium]
MRWSAPLMHPGHPVQLVLGPVLWAAWFVIVYAGLSQACAFAPPLAQGAFTWVNGLLLALTLGVTLILVACAWRCWEAAASAKAQALFVTRVAAGIYLFSAVSTLVVGAPVVVLPPCL